MPAVNAYEPWTEEDIALLKLMLYQGRRIDRMARILGRSSRAVQHATRFLLAGQVTVHGPDAVARLYGKCPTALLDAVVPASFADAAEERLVDRRPASWCLAFLAFYAASAIGTFMLAFD